MHIVLSSAHARNATRVATTVSTNGLIDRIRTRSAICIHRGPHSVRMANGDKLSRVHHARGLSIWSCVIGSQCACEHARCTPRPTCIIANAPNTRRTSRRSAEAQVGAFPLPFRDRVSIKRRSELIITEIFIVHENSLATGKTTLPCLPPCLSNACNCVNIIPASRASTPDWQRERSCEPHLSQRSGQNLRNRSWAIDYSRI